MLWNLVLKHFHWLFLIQPAFCGLKKERQLFWTHNLLVNTLQLRESWEEKWPSYVSIGLKSYITPKGHIKIKSTVITWNWNYQKQAKNVNQNRVLCIVTML